VLPLSSQCFGRAIEVSESRKMEGRKMRAAVQRS
jgi:hypothetical protein